MGYKNELQANNSNLQSVLETVNSLPENCGGTCTVVFNGTCKLYNIAYCKISGGEVVPTKVYAAGVTGYTLENVAAQSLLVVGVNANGGVTVGGGITDMGVLYSTSRAFGLDAQDGETVTITIASA